MIGGVRRGITARVPIGIVPRVRIAAREGTTPSISNTTLLLNNNAPLPSSSAATSTNAFTSMSNDVRHQRSLFDIAAASTTQPLSLIGQNTNDCFDAVSSSHPHHHHHTHACRHHHKRRSRHLEESSPSPRRKHKKEKKRKECGGNEENCDCTTTPHHQSIICGERVKRPHINDSTTKTFNNKFSHMLHRNRDKIPSNVLNAYCKTVGDTAKRINDEALFKQRETEMCYNYSTKNSNGETEKISYHLDEGIRCKIVFPVSRGSGAADFDFDEWC